MASRAYVLSTGPSDARTLASGGSSSKASQVGHIGLGFGTLLFISLVTVIMVTQGESSSS